MKKSKLLSIFLAMTLVVTTIFAGTESIFAESVSGNARTVPTIEAQDANSSEQLKGYTVTLTAGQSNKLIVPIHVSQKGTLKIPLSGVAVSKGVSVSLHTYPSADDNSLQSRYLSSSYPQNMLRIKLPQPGVYYLKFETSSYGNGEAQSVNFAAALYPAGGTPVKGKVFYGSSPDNGVSYYEVTAPGNGYLTVSFPKREQNSSSYYIKLLNYRKNSIFSDFEYVGSTKGHKTRIGVKKGTYYIAVKNSYDSSYGIKISFTGVTENSGKTRGKAKSIYKGGTKKGIITAAQRDNTGDWYKFKINKTQSVKFNISTLISQGGGYGFLKVSFYRAGQNYSFGSQNFYYNAPSGTVRPYYGYGTTTTMAPGTYYIKVQKYSGGNGYYKIKWN